MKPSHPWGEVEEACKAGKPIQFKNKVLEDNPWWNWTLAKLSPNFDLMHLEWRIKPETLKYRVGLFQNPETEFTWAFSVDNDDTANENAEADASFVRWLTPWTEVEI